LQAKPTHQNIIRLAPPLVITDEEIAAALDIIKAAVDDLPNLKGEAEDKVIPPPEKKVKINLEN
jgi:ornithine--oxo-acid transaminase